MKYKLLRFSLLSVLVMLCGSMAMADDVILWQEDFSSFSSGDVPSGGDFSYVCVDGGSDTKIYNEKTAGGTAPELLVGKSTGSFTATISMQGLSGEFILEWNSNNANIIPTSKDATLGEITVNSDAKLYSCTVTVKDKSSITLSFENKTTKNGRLDNIKFYQEALDTRTATKVTITEPAQEGTVGESLAYPTVTVTEAESGAVISGATVVWESSDPKVASIDRDRGYISLLAAGTTTISATYEGDETYKGSEASYKLNVYDAPIASLKALQEAATATETPVNIKFTDVQVVYVNGSNAYLADADGYGALVYTKEHGLEVGQVLNGTMSAKLMLYQGNTEITNFSKDGLTITTAAVNPVVMTKVTEANQSTLVTLKGVTYNETAGTLSDGENTITYYDKFKTNVALEDGKKYDITGIVVIFASKDETKIEICPRTAADVAEAATAPLYVIGSLSSGDWDRTAMDEIPYNATNNAYEKDFTTTDVVYFAFATKQMTADEANDDMDWSNFNANYRLGAGDGGNISAIFGEAMPLSRGDKTFMISSPGDYKLSVSKDMSSVTFTKMTVPTYTSVIIAGDAAFLGSSWNASDVNNKMEQQKDGSFKKVYENVEITEASSFEYKLVFDGSWMGGDNLSYAFKEAGTYTVTFTFDPATDKIECVAEKAGSDADSYEYTFEAKTFDAAEQTKELNGVNWTLATDAGYFGYDGTKGQQIGSGSKPATTISLSTNGISGVVKKVVINTSGSNGIIATVKVTVGDAIFTYEGEGSAQLTNTATEYVFEGSSAGDITISYTNESAKAIYIKSIQVNPADAPETYEITLAKDMISFSCGKDLDFSEVEGLTAYIVVGGTANTAKLQEVAQVPSGEGVILQGKAGTTYQVPVIEMQEGIATNFLFGTWSSLETNIPVDANSTYVLSDGTFKLYTGTEIESGKAFLSKDDVGSDDWLDGGSESAGARTIGIDDDATGIDSVTREALSNGKVYNLQGQEVKNAQKGFFIVNGKKVILK